MSTNKTQSPSPGGLGGTNAGSKGGNHNYMMRNLMILGQIEKNTDQTETLLSQILSTLQVGKDYEAFFVKDSTGAIWLETRTYNPDTNTWEPIKYYAAGSLVEGTPTAPVTYIDLSSILQSIDNKLTNQATSSLQTTGNTSLANIDTKTPSLINGAQPIILKGSSYTFSTLNSSSVQLAAGATFPGAIEDVTNLPAISLLLTSDQNMTITILQYIDSDGTKLASSTSFPIYAGVGFARSLPLNGNYVKVIVRNNGSSTTTTFQLDTAYGIIDSSDASGFTPVQQAVRYNQGNITTQNLAPTGVATVNSAVEIDLQGASQLAIQTTGTYTGVLSLQVTNDGSRWETVTATLINNFISGTWAATISSGTIGVFIVDVSSFYKARITALAAVTGTSTVTLRANSVSMTGVTRPMPAGTNAIGAVTQSGTWTVQIGNTPNTTAILANPLIPAVTTTGDTGAKTATGNGNGQTNTTGKGALITFNLGTVSGTSPTCVFKLQASADGGATWVDIPNANTATITATGAYGILINKGIASVAGVATAGTCAQVNSQLPRTWRVVWTIGGTTPSFTITNIQVSYLF